MDQKIAIKDNSILYGLFKFLILDLIVAFPPIFLGHALIQTATSLNIPLLLWSVFFLQLIAIGLNLWQKFDPEYVSKYISNIYYSNNNGKTVEIYKKNHDINFILRLMTSILAILGTFYYDFIFSYYAISASLGVILICLSLSVLLLNSTSKLTLVKAEFSKITVVEEDQRGYKEEFFIRQNTLDSMGLIIVGGNLNEKLLDHDNGEQEFKENERDNNP